MAAAATAAAATAGAASAARRLLLLALMCAALAASLPAHTKEGGDSAAAVASTGDECVSGHRKPNDEAGCGGNCYCLGGHWVCPESECGPQGNIPQKFRSEDLEPFPLKRSKRVPLDGERCAPGVTYMDECNTCICSQDGIKAHASCTFKICPK